MRKAYQTVVGLIVIAGLTLAHAGFAFADDASVQRAERRGTTMFWYDRAAWVTSDDLQARMPAERLPEIGGWIVTPAGSGYHVDYIGKGTAAEHVVYAADVDGRAVSNPVVYPKDAGPRLREPVLAMARALGAARKEMARHIAWQPCAPASFNTIVLPPDSDGMIAVYFLTPQTVSDSFPFGGHYEIDIAKDGHAVSARGFTRACLTLKKESHPSSAKPAALFLTHLLDPQPTEVHVFEQFGVGVPLYVGITEPRSVWKIDNGRILRVDNAKEQ